MTQNMNWQQFAGAPPAPAPAPAAAPWAPQQTPPGFPPQGAPAPVMAPQPAPVAPPGFPPQYAAPVAPQYAAPVAPQGYPSPYPQPAAPPQVAGGNAFGAGAFAGAHPMGQRKDCAEGLYACEITSTEQFDPQDRSGRKWRAVCKVLHAFEGSQPVGSEFSAAEGVSTDMQRDYAAATMLAISAAAYGVTDDAQLRQVLNSQIPPGATYPDGRPCDGWGTFSDAIQSKSQQMSLYFPPNPLGGKRLLVRCVLDQPVNKPGTKHHGKRFPRYAFSPLQGG